MSRISKSLYFSYLFICILVASLLIASCSKKEEEVKTPEAINPFANNNGQVPDTSEYSGPLFQLSYNYPQTPPAAPANPPWIQALNGNPISSANAIAYVNALKDYIAPAMETLIYDYQNWNAAQAGWYNQPWLFNTQSPFISLRESIHGMYLGSTFPPSMFPKSGLKDTMSTWVLTYYDSLAGYTIGKVWGKTALKPDITTENAQFLQNAIIVKVAVTTASPQQWPVMEGAEKWQAYVPTLDSMGIVGANDYVTDTYFMQFDIIVKDTITSPKTGWVFSTLVYDKDAPGKGWDKMIPLGAMWGNDPNVNSTINPNAKLYETVINPAAPVYSTETLGWGGRLSGPNDGAVVAPAATLDSVIIPSVAASSCMSCHGPAAYEQVSFLLPSPGTAIDNALVIYPPGGKEWMNWFQDRPGYIPQDAGQQALDYDMNFSFKTIPAWQAATDTTKKLFEAFRQADRIRRGIQYNGM